MKTYICLRRVSHDNVDYEPNDVIELEDEDAAAIGPAFLAPAEEGAKATKKPKPKKPA